LFEDKPTFQVLIGLGSNLGDRLGYLLQSIPELKSQGIIPVACAHVYETRPIGGCFGQFLNSVLVASSSLSPENLMTGLLAIERKLGRVRHSMAIAEGAAADTVELISSDRCIDLDLLMMRDLSGKSIEWKSPRLQLPHPRMHSRSFVLIPAAEVAGDWQFPVLGMTIAELRAKLSDELGPYASPLL
jgi:2-amino-4-hydroxy-6-hydroxymethyldihydropteridine diphosphokinase